MRIINFLNLKGGVAKTFSVVNMAYELWRRGYKVLILDNDKQGNLSKAYQKYDAEQTAPVTKLLRGEWECPEELIQHTDYDGIDIVPSNMSLFGAVWNLLKMGDRDLTEQYQRFIELVKNGGERETDSSPAGGYDYCLIDNPLDIGLNVINALAVADEVIVPVKIDEDALEAGFEWLCKEWDNVNSKNYRKYPVLGIIRYSKKVAESFF